MTGHIIRNKGSSVEVQRPDGQRVEFGSLQEAFDYVDAEKAKQLDELELNGWPERDDSPRQQRIEQGGELVEVYEVLDQIKGGNQ
ncbi:hypothetical protein [Azotobacter salinestris]|uniref:hypothetical protein n=1 Tax=Azotobacter salinestris TaxID=69964 RepID=UPI0032DEB481